MAQRSARAVRAELATHVEDAGLARRGSAPAAPLIALGGLTATVGEDAPTVLKTEAGTLGHLGGDGRRHRLGGDGIGIVGRRAGELHHHQHDHDDEDQGHHDPRSAGRSANAGAWTLPIPTGTAGNPRRRLWADPCRPGSLRPGPEVPFWGVPFGDDRWPRPGWPVTPLAASLPVTARLCWRLRSLSACVRGGFCWLLSGMLVGSLRSCRGGRAVPGRAHRPDEGCLVGGCGGQRRPGRGRGRVRPPHG